MFDEVLIGEKVVITNFSKKYCATSVDMLDSVGFKRMLDVYLKKQKDKNSVIYDYIKNLDIIDILKMLVVFDAHDIEKYYKLDKSLFLEFVEELYDFWRDFERYAIIINKDSDDAIQQVNFIDSMEHFKNLVLTTYRKIEETLMQAANNVYRQLNAGVNVGIAVGRVPTLLPKDYQALSRVDFVKKVVIQPPFFVYTKQNTRKGIFNEIFENPIKSLQFDSNKWLCYPAKIGEKIAFVYFNTDFMAQGISLSNLFEMAETRDYKNKKPDIILIFGAEDGESELKYPFYVDKENNIVVGYLNHNEKIDYFGYMKKALLTTYNIKMIENGNLPIHGAMVNITLKNNKSVNLVLMGDSGAGKSESLEAFRQIADDYIKGMKVIFDDMGYFAIRENKVYGYGTETGAFVRLDDLDKGYAYKTMDRSIFLNPNRINARVVLPITTYKIVNMGYEVEYFLYANNYEKDGKTLEFFKNIEDAKKVFTLGKRMAKGTTSEVGITTSYFANPFGPAQREKETNVLIDKFFEKLFKDGVKVGQIKTKLGIEGMEQEGPLNAAKDLLNAIKS
ncbi:MAG: hypothetical protein LBC92_04405 [Rickettsiales bacterium]|jgi:energy-coupling factor transporter ATP-binding protein EcfA2|nr:hypothetical protein [Rickettsiales bacterium]